MGFAKEVADKVVMMDNGQIVEIGSAEKFLTMQIIQEQKL